MVLIRATTSRRPPCPQERGCTDRVMAVEEKPLPFSTTTNSWRYNHSIWRGRNATTKFSLHFVLLV